jgi:hypothetical protein
MERSNGATDGTTRLLGSRPDNHERRHLTANEQELRHLLEEVIRTKAEHRDELGRRINPTLIFSTREASLTALEDYVFFLEALRLPVPPRMHRDLEILRVLCLEIRNPRP